MSSGHRGSGALTYTWDNGVINNVSFTPTGTRTYVLTGRDHNNCENTDQITVTVNEPTHFTLDTTICAGSTLILGTQVLDNDGSYTETFGRADQHGCDSIVTLNLSIAPADVSVTQKERTLTATESNATYQWINCSNFMPITGANNQSFSSNVGNFAVIITQQGCSDPAYQLPEHQSKP